MSWLSQLQGCYWVEPEGLPDILRSKGQPARKEPLAQMPAAEGEELSSAGVRGSWLLDALVLVPFTQQ